MKTRREFLQMLGIAALATPVAYSFLGSGTLYAPSIDIVAQSMGFDAVSGKWMHVAVSGFKDPDHNGMFKILSTDYNKDAYILQRTEQRQRVGGAMNSCLPPQEDITDAPHIVLPFRMTDEEL